MPIYYKVEDIPDLFCEETKDYYYLVPPPGLQHPVCRVGECQKKTRLTRVIVVWRCAQTYIFILCVVVFHKHSFVKSDNYVARSLKLHVFELGTRSRSFDTCTCTLLCVQVERIELLQQFMNC